MAIRVVVADDSLLVREGLQHMLEGSSQFKLVAVAKDRETLLAAIEVQTPDVVIFKSSHGHQGKGGRGFFA